MAIAAKRFEFLSGETNVGISNLLDKTDSAILNSPAAALLEITVNQQAMVDTNIQDPLYIDELIKEMAGVKPYKPEPTFPTDVRETKDFLGAVKDLSKLSTKDLDKSLALMIPGVPNALSGMSILCKQGSFGFGGLGKPFDFNIDCGGSKKSSKTNCNTGQFPNIISKLTGGAYNATFSDLNSLLSNLVNLSSYGYDLNLCGVFGSLAGAVGIPSVNNRAAAGILTALTEKKNTLGIFDLANGVASLGLIPKLEMPSAVNSFLTKFSIPDGVKEYDYASLSDRALGSAEIFEENWNKNHTNSVLAIEEASMGYNADLDSVMTCSRLNNTFTEDNLDYIPVDDHSFMSAAYSTSSNTSSSFYDYEADGYW